MELTRALVASDGKHVRSSSAKYALTHGFVGKAWPDLGFTPYQLFHATAKADLLRVRSLDDIEEHQEEISFLCRRLFDWDQRPLRIRTGRAARYKSRPQLAGTLGEGIALLLMDRMGFPYWDHAESVLRRARGEPVDDGHPEALPHTPPLCDGAASGDETPDFVCENATGQFAITEAKGGFARPTPPTLPAIKRELAGGLDQIDALSKKFSIMPPKSYVVGSYFREVGDSCSESPIIAFVDPEFADVDNDGFPDDWVRRGNYAAWLTLMGFPRTADALRDRREGEPRVIVLPVVALAGRQFALTVLPCSCWDRLGLAPNWDGLRSVAQQPIPADILWFLLVMMSQMKRPMRVVGLEVDVLRRVGAAAVFPGRASLAQLPVLDAPRNFNAEWFTGSVLSDGTLFGDIYPDSGQSVPLSYMEFKL